MDKNGKDMPPPKLPGFELRRENAMLSEPSKTPFDQYGRRTYNRTCRKLGVNPISAVGEFKSTVIEQNLE